MPPTSSQTKPGPRKLSDVAKHLVAPAGITSTGWPAVEKTCVEKLGITFDDWQQGAGRLMLAKRKDGHLAAMVDGVGLSVCRQVGKTYFVAGMTFGLCVNNPGLLVIWSAHHARTHTETFLAMQGFAQRTKVAPHVAQVFTGSGTEEIRFHNGSRILFGARERGFGRGIPGVDVLVMDEAQILSDKAMSNMLATMNTSQFGLQLYIGTPPKPDDMSEAFTRMRTEALAGRLTDGAWIELGADDDAKPGDRKQWVKANPSHPKRTPAQSILRLQRKLTPEDFLREGLGRWDDPSEAALISQAAWRKAAAPATTIDGARALGLDVTLDQSKAAIAGAGLAGARMHVEQIIHQSGTGWVVPAAVDLQARHPGVLLVVDERSPAAALIPDLEEAGVELLKANTAHVTDGCAWMYTAIHDGAMTHADDADMNAAVAGTKKRPVGDRYAWGRKQSVPDITTFNAATLAAWVVVLDDLPAGYDPLASLGANTKGT
jgi:hypothetical protein